MIQDSAKRIRQSTAPFQEPVENHAKIGFGRYQSSKTFVGIGTRPSSLYWAVAWMSPFDPLFRISDRTKLDSIFYYSAKYQ